MSVNMGEEERGEELSADLFAPTNDPNKKMLQNLVGKVTIQVVEDMLNPCLETNASSEELLGVLMREPEESLELREAKVQKIVAQERLQQKVPQLDLGRLKIHLETVEDFEKFQGCKQLLLAQNRNFWHNTEFPYGFHIVDGKHIAVCCQMVAGTIGLIPLGELNDSIAQLLLEGCVQAGRRRVELHPETPFKELGVNYRKLKSSTTALLKLIRGSSQENKEVPKGEENSMYYLRLLHVIFRARFLEALFSLEKEKHKRRCQEECKRHHEQTSRVVDNLQRTGGTIDKLSKNLKGFFDIYNLAKKSVIEKETASSNQERQDDFKNRYSQSFSLVSVSAPFPSDPK